MAVRVDRAGHYLSDYHTVGAGLGNPTAEGKIKITENSGKIEIFVTRREYVADASFLVVLQGPDSVLEEFCEALAHPAWQPYLGRKACPPGLPLLEREPLRRGLPDLRAALRAVPWFRRCEDEQPPETLDCWIEWRASSEDDTAPPDAAIWYDDPISFDPPVHGPRFVCFQPIRLDEENLEVSNERIVAPAPAPPRPRADYTNTQYRSKRAERLRQDYHLCVFCKAQATTVQHITYARAGGKETVEDLRSLCRLCHDAVTMIEYGERMGLERIDPTDPRWRDRIIEMRDEILRYRSMKTRTRLLGTEVSEE
jgi:hypothetical protein